MRSKWEPHGREDNTIHELYIWFGDGRIGEWRIVGWVQPRPDGYFVYCHWIDNGDYPENKMFNTAKQARRALKAAATIAIVGGWQPKNF